MTTNCVHPKPLLSPCSRTTERCEGCPMGDKHALIRPSFAGGSLSDIKIFVLADGLRYYNDTGTICKTYHWLLNDILVRAFKQDLRHIYLMPTLPCEASSVDDKRHVMECNREKVLEVLKQTSCHLIICLGKFSQEMVAEKAKLESWCGVVADGVGEFAGYKYLSTYAPADVYLKRPMHPVFMSHLHRALTYIYGKGDTWDYGVEIPYIGNEPGETEKAIEHLSQILKTQKCVTVDIETSGLDPHDKSLNLLNIGIASDLGSISVTPDIDKTVDCLVQEILASESVEKIFHNCQFDVWFLTERGYVIKGKIHDTMIAHTILFPRLPHTLDFVAHMFTNAPRWKSEFRITTDETGTKRYTAADPYDRAIYNLRDCTLTHRLHAILDGHLTKRHKGPEQYTTAMELTTLAINMRRRGVRVDLEQVRPLSEFLENKKITIEEKLTHLTKDITFDDGEPFSPTKLRHLKKVFTHLGVQTDSLDKEALQDLQKHDIPEIRDFATGMYEWRKVSKTFSGFIYPVSKAAQGKESLTIHPVWKPLAAVTGRWACTEPNMMNQPKEVRVLYMAREDMKLVEMDYQALEAWILAYLSEDQELLDMLNSDDIHMATARQVFHTDSPTPAQRQIAKSCRYRLHYRGSAQTGYDTLKLTFPDIKLADIQAFDEAFYRVHKGIHKWQEAQVRSALDNSYVEIPISGRRVHFYGDVRPQEAVNLPIQGTGADLTNRAMLTLSKTLEPPNGVIIQVHDSLVGEAMDSDVDVVAKAMKEAMTAPVEINGNLCSFGVDCKTGKNWGKMEDYKWTIQQ